MSQPSLRLGFLVSHQGSNLDAVLRACADGTLRSTPVVAISNNSASRGLERARSAGLEAHHMSSVTHPDPVELDLAIQGVLASHSVDLVLLVGYMKKLGPRTLDRYRNRVLNIHPALLPRYGGHGYFGKNVHQAVLDAGEPVTGITIHVVDGGYDTGSIVAQCEVVVEPGDTVDSLQVRVLDREHGFLVETLGEIERGERKLPD